MSLTLDQLQANLRASLERKRYRAIDFYVPRPKQQAFHDLGATIRERLFMAGNQLGKTYAGAAEVSFHLTGDYPDDWLGRRFDHPTKIWVVGESGLAVRDTCQKLLCGEAGVDSAFGTGMIPRESFADKPSLGRGVTDGYDTVQVFHKTNGVADGVSILRFKSYEQGRTKLQGESIDMFWCDEEPDEAIYSEILTRISATGGCGIMTFTPLKGMTKVAMTFLNVPSPDRSVTNMTIYDRTDLTEAERNQIIAGYPAHERDARTKGVPMLGEGLIYQVPEEIVRETAIRFLPEHWAKLWAVDFGIAKDHPFAAVLLAWDKDADVIHVIHTIKMVEQRPMHHAKAMIMVAGNVPVIWPHDGNNREKGNGETLASQYKAEGLLMTPSHSTWVDGGYTVEPGIMEIQQREETARFRVAAHLEDYFSERRLYHRKDGLIVKAMDDVLDATRIGVMGKRFAKAVPLIGGVASRRNDQKIAKGVDFDLS